jgi:hypothetical protein
MDVEMKRWEREELAKAKCREEEEQLDVLA